MKNMLKKLSVLLFCIVCVFAIVGCDTTGGNKNENTKYTSDTENEILDALNNEFIQGLTLLGGEPFEPENQRELISLLRKVKELYPAKDIWSYTGFVYDKDLLVGQRKHTEVTDEMLSYLDILVDGPFIEEKKNICLKFRGSENQRIIDMKKTIETKSIVLSPLNN